MATAAAIAAAFAGGGHAAPDVAGGHFEERAAIARAAPSVVLNVPAKSAPAHAAPQGFLALAGLSAAGVLLVSKRARAVVAKAALTGARMLGGPLVSLSLVAAAAFFGVALIEARDLDWVAPAFVAGGLALVALRFRLRLGSTSH